MCLNVEWEPGLVVNVDRDLLKVNKRYCLILYTFQLYSYTVHGSGENLL